MNEIYPFEMIREYMNEFSIKYDSILKQRVAIVSIQKNSKYDYIATFQPVRMQNCPNRHDDNYSLHASELPNRFKVIARI